VNPRQGQSESEGAFSGSHIRVNGALRPLPGVPTLQGLLEELGLPAPDLGLAVIRNGAVVRRAEWPATALAPDDELEIVRATVGG